jgi:hypothetical protein
MIIYIYQIISYIRSIKSIDISPWISLDDPLGRWARAQPGEPASVKPETETEKGRFRRIGVR